MKYNTLASKEIVEKTVKALELKHTETVVAKNKIQALEKIKGFIPHGVSVMNGSSVSLEQIGFVEYLKSGKHGWKNLHEGIIAEKDPAKQAVLRKQSVLSDYYVGSVHALCENGDFIIASNTGSQLPHIVFTSQNLIFVVSTKKIVPTLSEAMKRLEEYVVPLEDKHMMGKYGVNTAVNKIVIFKNENPMLGRKVRMILVEENLGF
jgi:L-lactate utilization protein LutC